MTLEIDPSHVSSLSPAWDCTIRQRLAVSELTTFRWSFEDDARNYRAAGIEALGVWRLKVGECGERRAAELLLEQGLHVSSIAVAGGFTGANGASRREMFDDGLDAIRLADIVNAPTVVVRTGDRAGHTRSNARRIVVDALRELGDLAGAHGISLAIQPVHPKFTRGASFVSSLDGAQDLLTSVGHDAVGLALDVYALSGEQNLVERLPELARSIRLVQLSDWRENPRSDVDRLPPGAGTLPLNAIVQALEANNYRGYYEILVLSEKLWAAPQNYHSVLAHCLHQSHALFPEFVPAVSV